MIELKITIIKKLIGLLGALIIALQTPILGVVASIETDLLVPRKQINLNVLEEKILKQTGWKHSTPTSAGFSGLNMDEVEENGVAKTRIRIVWSDDGKNGYEKELTKTDETLLQGLVNAQ